LSAVAECRAEMEANRASDPLDGNCESRSIEAPELRHWSACMRELSLHILDVMQNSLEAGATLVQVVVDENSTADRLTITVADNGRGMSEEQLARVFDPFYTTRKTRHVGLGLPLFKAAAERCNGDLTLTSQLGQGTKLEATFQHSHVDRAPLGDIAGALLTVILGGKECDIHYIHRVDGKEFEFNTADIKAELGEVPLSHPEVRKWLQEFMAEGEAALPIISTTLELLRPAT